MIGRRLITPYSNKDGLLVNQVYILEQLNIKKELYISFKFEDDQLRLQYSTKGGIPIRELRAKHESDLKRIYFDPVKGPELDALAAIADDLGLQNYRSNVIYLIMHLYECFIERDCEFLEVNPLVLTKEGNLMAVQSNVQIDDSALFRQAELEAEMDRSQFTYTERIAENFDLTYEKAKDHGNIGVICNGAGLTMATMDLIKEKGGAPANFFDCGGPSGRE
jgi:succinyl-CoA synthetase beta subunit